MIDYEYERDHSHSHCWENSSPPCGQKIKHLECCLCEKVNPDYISRTELLEKINKFEKRLNDPEDLTTFSDIYHIIKGE